MFNTQRDLEDYIQKVKFYGNNDNKQQQSRTIEIKAHKLCQRRLQDYVNFSLEGNLDGVRHLLNPTGLLLMTQEEMKSVIRLLDKPYFFFYVSLFLIHIVIYFHNIITYKLWNKI